MFLSMTTFLIGWNLFLSLAPNYHFYAVEGKNLGHYRSILDKSQVDSALDELELDVWNNFNKRLLNDKWLLGTKLIINYYWNYSHISNVCWNFIILVITIFSLKSKFKKILCNSITEFTSDWENDFYIILPRWLYSKTLLHIALIRVGHEILKTKRFTKNIQFWYYLCVSSTVFTF